MAWTTKTGINLRSTTAFVTDPGGTVAMIGANGGSNAIAGYAGSGNNNPLTVNGNTFSIGWVKTSDRSNVGTGIDGARNRSTGVDARLAGAQCSFTSTNCTLQVQLGNSRGPYKIWLGIGSQGVGTGTTSGSIPVYDALGSASSPLFSIALPASISSNQFIGADGTVYASAAAWAATADTSGASVTFVSNDASNGNGGPLISLDCGGLSGNAPIAHIAFQYVPQSPLLGTFVGVLP
jgi:hypothetical protein